MVRPKKHLGQHFLKDDNISRKIVGYISPETKHVIEIGPGTGMLTKHLLNSGFPTYIAIEIDKESVEYLNSQYPEHAGKFVCADFLRMDLEQFLPEKALIIGNFPYNISSQILFRVFENKDKIDEVIGMFQKEVAERIISPPGNKKYGILSVLIQAFYHTDYLFTVSKNVFYPPPKVQSAVIRLKRNNIDTLGCNENLFIKLVKAGFNQRRKTLKNSLHDFSFSKDDMVQRLLTKRAEMLEVSDFVMLAKNIANVPE